MSSKSVKLSNTSNRRPILSSLLLGVVLTLLVSIAAAAATIAELGDTGIMAAQGCAFLIMALVVTILMRKKDSTLAAFGFKRFRIREHQNTLYYIPLLAIALVQPVMGGFNPELSVGGVLLILGFTLVVGFTEESIFRGMIKEKLSSKSSMFYIFFSSIFFGILHMANAFSGSGALAVTMQVLNAFLLGLILALLIELTSNIIPLILFHFLFDALAKVTDPTLDEQVVLVVSILNLIYLLYGIYLVIVLTRRIKAPLTISA